VLFRLTESRDSDRTVVHLAGRLVGPAAPEFCEFCRSQEAPIILDLSELQWADSDGVRAVRKVMSEGAETRGASRFIELLLRGARVSRHGSCPDDDNRD
jgi:hypothetical protein